MLAGVAAEAVTDQLGNGATLIFKFHGVSMAALDDGIAFYTVQAEILYTVFHVVLVPTLRNGAADDHFLQIVQRKRKIIIAADVHLFFRIGSAEPKCRLGRGEHIGVKGDKEGADHVEFPVDIGIHQGNDPLVLGQLDFEAVVYSGYHANLPFQLSIHIYPIARFQIELVVVVGKPLVPAGKTDLNNGLPRRGCCRGGASGEREADCAASGELTKPLIANSIRIPPCITFKSCLV